MHTYAHRRTHMHTGAHRHMPLHMPLHTALCTVNTCADASSEQCTFHQTCALVPRRIHAYTHTRIRACTLIQLCPSSLVRSHLCKLAHARIAFRIAWYIRACVYAARECGASTRPGACARTHVQVCISVRGCLRVGGTIRHTHRRKHSRIHVYVYLYVHAHTTHLLIYACALWLRAAPSTVSQNAKMQNTEVPGIVVSLFFWVRLPSSKRNAKAKTIKMPGTL
jgi:hypothetical protein